MGAYTLWCFAVSIIGFVLIGVLLYRNRKPSTWFLAYFLFSLAYGCFVLFLWQSKYLLQVPFFFRTPQLLLYSVAPSLLFYIRYLINEKRTLTWIDSLHLIPALVFAIDFSPYFLTSIGYKRQVIEAYYQNEPSAVLFKESWFMPEGLHYLLRHLIAVGYLLYIIMLLRTKANELQIRKLLRNIHLKQWLVLMLIFFLPYTILGIITYLISYTQYAFLANFWGAIFVFSGLTLTLLLKPYILYGPNPFSQKKRSRPADQIDKLTNQIQNGLLECIDKKIYIRKNIKLDDVADELGIQPYILSSYINHSYSMRFNEFINWFRIQHVKDLLQNDSKSKLTLEAIAEEVGFSNRISFLQSFKKFTGITPSAFMQGASMKTGIPADTINELQGSSSLEELKKYMARQRSNKGNLQAKK